MTKKRSRTKSNAPSRPSLEPKPDVAEFSPYVAQLSDRAEDGIERADHEHAHESASDAKKRARHASSEARAVDIESELRAVEEAVDKAVRRNGAGRVGQHEDDRGEAHTDRSGARPMRRADDEIGGHGRDDFATSAAKDVLATDYSLKQWGRAGLRRRSEDVDEYGFDPALERKLKPVIQTLYRRYFRAEARGVERVPAEGRCVLVANHSGVLPLDGLMVRTAVREEHPSRREVRWLAEDHFFHLPYLGAYANRLGAVRACQENAQRLLEQERCVLVFPEGIQGTGKLYGDRYKLQRFGRGGFIKLALRTKSPVVPVAIVGAEETSPLLYRIDHLSSVLGIPFLPITPTFPWFGPFGLLPAPTKWKIAFGEPMYFDEGAEAADDELVVARLSERVRGEIQTSLDAMVNERKSVWFG